MRRTVSFAAALTLLFAAPAIVFGPSSAYSQARSAPSTGEVRTALTRAIRAAQASNRARGVTGADAEANIKAAIQQEVIALNAPPSVVQTALSSLGAVASEPGVSGAVASVQTTVTTAVAQAARTESAAATSAPVNTTPASTTAPASAGGAGGGGGGSDYRG